MLFDVILPSINNKTENLFDIDIDIEKEYSSYIVNKAFSFGLDSLIYANCMNYYCNLPRKMQYDFYYYGLDKRKRWNKWIKEEKIEAIDRVKEYYNCSLKKARQYMTILNDNDLKIIYEKTNKGSSEKV
jgi:hypothetical protein